MALNISNIEVKSYNTIIVGSGAAAFNAANTLFEMGQEKIAIVTEGLKCGTSRNTGSDKQTYYKMSTSGEEGDSPYKMAQTLFDGGAMHGDIALVEAALSTMSFYNLKRIGVPFPTDRYGQHVGYKTDHDPYTRASSAGPLTSKYMTECLEQQVNSKGIKIFDCYQVVAILKDEKSSWAVGLLCIDHNNISEDTFGFVLLNCVNIIYCTGGPSCIYWNSVYPPSQFGGTGIALEAGALGVNLTEWQYGLASTKFRWNVSGTYQQVLPRYVSTDKDMQDEREFLCDHFEDFGGLCDAVFLKGYQWPFDPRKISDFASSTIDILVYIETQVKGRRVFMDFTQNPSYPGIDQKDMFSHLSKESYDYLEKSKVLFGLPIDRLKKMNPLAIELYMNNGIDITKEYLEIDVCAQHNNGGLLGDIWWESNLRGLFPVGEVNGSLGIYRPGGSALNSTQVGGVRAATLISQKRNGQPLDTGEFLHLVSGQVHERYKMAKKVKISKDGNSNVVKTRQRTQKAMTKTAAFFRGRDEIEGLLPKLESEIESVFDGACVSSVGEVGEVFRNYDMLICQYTYLSAMLEHIHKGGKSRGSYIVIEDEGEQNFGSKSFSFGYSTANSAAYSVCISSYDKISKQVRHKFEEVREIPREDNWFETVWEQYRTGSIYN